MELSTHIICSQVPSVKSTVASNLAAQGFLRFVAFPGPSPSTGKLGGTLLLLQDINLGDGLKSAPPMIAAKGEVHGLRYASTAFFPLKVPDRAEMQQATPRG